MYCTKHNLCRVYEKVCTFSYTLYKSKIFSNSYFSNVQGCLILINYRQTNVKIERQTDKDTY